MNILRLIMVSLILIFKSSLANSECIVDASNRYGVSPVLLYAIAVVESNLNPKAVNVNKNGSRDFGMFQINERNLKKLNIPKRYAFDPCFSAYIGAYILRSCMQMYGVSWKAVDCYNKGKKAREDSRYVRKVIKVLREVGYKW